MISDVKVWPVKRENSRVKANASFIVNNAFRVKCTVFNGEKGMFVGLPGKYSEKVDPETNKKKWYPDVDVIDDTVRKQMTDAVLKEYNNAINNTKTAPAAKSDDNIPF